MNPLSGRASTVWDLPTRVFHWLLAAAVTGLLITGKMGGDAMEWHARFGYCVGALLMFRIVWGFVGGRWSRFSSFAPSLARASAYLRTPRVRSPGHNPLGAFSVYAMLLCLALQVSSGLFSETKEDFAGPLTSIASNATVHFMTGYHKRVGQYVVIALVLLHIAAIAFHALRGERLVPAMWHGRKQLAADEESSVDNARSRTVAAIVMSLCSLVMWGIAKLGS